MLGEKGSQSPPYKRATRIFDDLDLDSLEALELLVIVESLAGLMVPPEETPLIFTLGDAYNYYQQARIEARHG